MGKRIDCLGTRNEMKMLKEKAGRPGWWATVLFVAQLTLMGCISVVLVACVLIGALWYREGSPSPLIYLQRSKPGLSASEPQSGELTLIPPSTALPGGDLSEAQPSDTKEAVSVPEATAGEQSPSSLRQPFGDVQEAALSGEPAVSQAPGLVASLPHRPATRIVIPAISVDAPVRVIPIRNGTWDVKQITYEVGHLQGTASPGENSNVVMAGHITLATGGYGPFRGLAQLQRGDQILVYVGDGEVYVYTVDSIKTVKATDVEVVYPTTEPILTLITCVNWDPVQGHYSNRLVVVAHLGD